MILDSTSPGKCVIPRKIRLHKQGARPKQAGMSALDAPFSLFCWFEVCGSADAALVYRGAEMRNYHALYWN